MRRTTYYRDEEWVPRPRDLTAKDSGRIDPRELAAFAAPGNQLRKSPEQWRDFVEDVRTHGVRSAITVYVRPGRGPYLDEGNHRLVAALEVDAPTVPVDIYYYGGSEKLYSLG